MISKSIIPDHFCFPVATTNASYDAARTSANNAWYDLQYQVGLAVTAATTANSAAVTASTNLLSQLDTDFAIINAALVAADTQLSTSTYPLIDARATGENTEHPKDWDVAAKAQWYDRIEQNWIRPAQYVMLGVTVVAAFVTCPMLAIGVFVADVSLGAASFWVNYNQGDITGMVVDTVSLGLSIKRWLPTPEILHPYPDVRFDRLHPR